MKLESLELNNFMAIGQSGVLSLDGKGLVVIQGVNNDDASAPSNGAGKSSIPDGLVWCLYGDTARGESGDKVVNDKAKKDCWVRAKLHDGDVFYEITRYRKHKDYKNKLMVATWDASNPTNRVDLTKGTDKETQAVVEKILGCSYEVFKGAIYAGQEQMPDIPAMTDKELKLLVEQAAGIEHLEQAYAIAREIEDKIKSSMRTTQTVIEMVDQRLQSIATERAEVQQRFDVFEAGRAARKADADKRAATYADAMKRDFAELKAIDQNALSEERTDIAAKLANHNAMMAQRDNLSRAVNAAQQDYNNAAQVTSGYKAEVVRTQNAVNSPGIIVGTPCEACGKPTTPDDVDQARRFYAGRASEMEAHACTAEGQQAQCKVALDTAQKAYNDFVATIPDVSALTTRSADINGIINKAGQLTNQIRLLKKDYDVIKSMAEHAMTEINPDQRVLESIEQRTKDEVLHKEEAQKELAKLQHDAEVAALVTKVYSPAGVRAQILDTVTPFLNERTSEYLNAISDGNLRAVWSTLSTTSKGELREKFNIAVENEHGTSGFGSLSGGEKRKVRLAAMLALQDLVAARATKPIQIWIGDEIDDALDGGGLERLMMILEKKAREKGTVLIISHNDLTDWCDQTVTVTKSGKRSTITGVLCNGT